MVALTWVMRVLHAKVNTKLEGIARLLPRGKYKLTLVARNVEDDGAHILWTDDEPDRVVAAIRELERQNAEAAS